MTAPDKPGLSNEEFIKEAEMAYKLSSEHSCMQYFKEAIMRLETSAVKIGQVNDLLKDTDKHAEFYFMHQDSKILQAELEAEGVDVEGAKKKLLARLAEIKAGLPPTQGKPTPGQIGLVDGDKLIEKLTIESALTRETPEGKGWIEAMNAVKYWTRLGDFSVSGQGQEERDYTNEEANAEAKRLYGEGAWAQYSPFNPHGPYKFYRITVPKGDNPEWILGHGNSFRAAFASADAAKPKEDGE